MKQQLLKSLLAIALLCVGVGNVWADVIEIVGATDCSSEFNVSRSSTDFYITGNGGRHITFVNHNNNGSVWNNWLLCINDGGSTEYMFLRADNYGWDANLYNNYIYGAGLDWNTFVSDLNGATVDMYIYRKGTNVFVRNTITTSSSETYYYDACGYNITAETIHPYLSVDHSYLEITGNEAIAENDMPTLPDYPTIGNSTTQVWTEAKQPITMSKGNAYYFKFTNTMIGANSWENYKFRGYQTADCFIIRADNWDDKNEGDVSFSSNFDWPNFKDDLNGATVEAVFAYNSDGTVFFRTQVTPSTAGRSTVRYEQYTYSSTFFTDADIQLYPAVNGSYIEMMSQTAAYKVELTTNNGSYGTAAITSETIGGYVGSGNSVTVTATPADGYVFNGWKNGETYVSRNSTYTFDVTANTTLQAEFMAIKTSWDFTSSSWAKETGFDDSKSVKINKFDCTYANGDLAGLALQGGSGTGWTVNKNGLTQGNGARNIGILNCTAGQMVTITTATTLSNPVNGTLIGTATTGTVRYKVNADGTFGFQTTRSAYITSIAVTDMVEGTIPLSGFGSLASAYGLDFSSATISEGELTAYVVSEITKEKAKLTSVTEMPANSGVILEGTAGATYSIPVKSTATFVGTNKLQAAVTATEVAANEAYILKSGEFHLVTAASTVPAGKAYLLASDVPSGAKAMRFVFDGDEDGIEAIENGQKTMDNAEIFNLAGQRVNKAQKGVFIVNGKKVVVK